MHFSLGHNIVQFSEILIKQFNFATWFLAKRQHISWQEIASAKMIIDEGEMMGELVNLWEENKVKLKIHKRN